MRARGLDALVVFGSDGLGHANAPFVYFIGSAHVTSGLVIVTASGEQYLVHHSMERDEAAKTGLRLIDRSQYRYPELLQQHNGDRLAADVALMQRLFSDLGVRGRVAFYGYEAINRALPLLQRLQQNGACEVVTEYEQDVLSLARATKDSDEVAAIRETCRLTERVIESTRAFLQSHRVVDEQLVRQDGQPLTVAEVKRFIRREVAALGLELADCIFAIGRDAGVPHSVGEPSAVLRLGQTIVFDIYPRGPSGYHADITRTWCLGYAPPHVQAAHELVLQALALVEQRLNTQDFTYTFNEAVCALFEAHGFPTLRQDPSITRGYVHSLGHGFGLAVHEAPSMSLRGWRPEETLRPGSVFCIEPGLYDPDDPRGGWGVRVEDDYWFDENGMLHRLTTTSRELIVAMGD